MDPSTLLINIAATAVFALLIAGTVGAVLWLFLRRAPEVAPNRAAPKPTLRQRLTTLAELALIVAATLLGNAAQAAFGAPVGEPSSPVLEVIEVGECERPLTGFGLTRACELGVYRSPEAIDHPGPVVGGAPIEPGDRVAEYSSAGWTRWLQMFGDRSQWRSLDDTGKPNLDWLPAVTVLGTALALRIPGRRVPRRPTSEETEVR